MLYILPCLVHTSTRFLSNALRGNLLHFPQLLSYVEKCSVDGENRKDWQLEMILETKQELWAKINMLGGLNEIMSVKVLVNGSTLTTVPKIQ